MELVILICVILFVVTLLLAIADHFLIRYGQCRISVSEEGQTRSFEVKGGATLLTSLTENGIEVRSPCGGKATCGYCKTKVVNGGGPVLPTEEALIGTEELRENMRLACQVKVKNDIELVIPEYFAVVRNIVKNKSYDPNLRYMFLMGEKPELPEALDSAASAADIRRLDAILDEYKGFRGSLVPILQKISATFKFLPKEILVELAKKLEIPLSSIYRVATFYHAFSLEPRGENIVSVCVGTACHVNGSEAVMNAFESDLQLKRGQTDENFKFSLEPVACLGCCGLAPVTKIGDKVFGHLTRTEVKRIVVEYKEKAR